MKSLMGEAYVSAAPRPLNHTLGSPIIFLCSNLPNIFQCTARKKHFYERFPFHFLLTFFFHSTQQVFFLMETVSLCTECRRTGKYNRPRWEEIRGRRQRVAVYGFCRRLVRAFVYMTGLLTPAADLRAPARGALTKRGQSLRHRDTGIPWLARTFATGRYDLSE